MVWVVDPIPGKLVPGVIVSGTTGHLVRRMRQPLCATIDCDYGATQGTVMWMDRDALYLLTQEPVADLGTLQVRLALPDQASPIRLEVEITDDHGGNDNPYRLGRLYECAYDVPLPDQALVLDRALRDLNPAAPKRSQGGPRREVALELAWPSDQSTVPFQRRKHFREHAANPVAEEVRRLTRDAEGANGGLRRFDRQAPDQIVPEALLVRPLFSDGEIPSLLAAFSDWDNLRASTRTDGEGMRLVLAAIEDLSALDIVQLVARLPDGMSVQLQMIVARIGPKRMVLSSRAIPAWARTVMARQG